MEFKLGLLCLCATILVAQGFLVTPTVTDGTTKDTTDLKDMQMKQKFLFDILRHVHQPIQQTEFLTVGETFIVDKTKYTKFEYVSDFFKTFKMGFLPRGEVFSIFNERHLNEAILLFNLFYYSVDYDTFSKNVIWARTNINEGMFIYALTVAVYHRPDFEGIELPAPYETYPYYFFDAETLEKASLAKLASIHKNYTYIIDVEDNDWFHITNEEKKLTYFTEDIGVNSYYYWFHIDYPFWMGGSDFGLFKDRRGEQFLYMYQQLLARYYLERISNGMSDIPMFGWWKPITNGYYSNLQYYNGRHFPYRVNEYNLENTEEYLDLNRMFDLERRFRDIIHMGFLNDGDKKIDVSKPEHVDFLGSFYQGNPDGFFGNFTNDDLFKFSEIIPRKFLGGAYHHYQNDYKILPSVLEHYETSMRDPIFYSFYDRLVKYWIDFKWKLPAYTEEEIIFKGVTIDSVEMTELTTYFEDFYADISNAVDIHLHMTLDDFLPTKELSKWKKYNKGKTWDFLFLAKQQRINHDPFNITMSVMSDVDQEAVVRIFMGPKIDGFGNKYYELNKKSHRFVELDQFTTKLVAGTNTILRKSDEFMFTVRDRRNYYKIARDLAMQMEGVGTYIPDTFELHCGWPDRLLLPKGHKDGYPFEFFFMVTPYVKPKVEQFSTYDSTKACGVGSGSRFIDDMPFGYPFDRKMWEIDFYSVPNMKFADFSIYHKDVV